MKCTFFRNVLVLIGFLFVAFKANDYFCNKKSGHGFRTGAFSIFASLLSILTMSDPFKYQCMNFDIRSIPIFFVSYVYGWKAGFISAIIPSLYRIYLGGIAVPQGIIIELVLSVLVGGLFYKLGDTTLEDTSFDIKKILTAYLGYCIIRGVLFYATLPISYSFWIKITSTMTIFSLLALLCMVLFINDYNRRNYLMAEMEKKQERIENLNKELKIANDAKSNFIANVSHELKTPLNITMTYLEYLLEEQEGDLNTEQKELLEIAYNNSDRLKLLIMDLLEISLLETEKVKFIFNRINFNEFINNIVNDRMLVIKDKNINIIIDIPQKDISIVTDTLRLRQVIDNLIDNAIKFSDNEDIEIIVKEKENNIEIYIKDSGIGIDPIKINDIFQPFYQVDDSTKKKYKGVGLGLAICKKIVNVLGGDISVNNNSDKGCCFKIAIPVNSSAKEGHNEKNIYS